MIIQTTKLNARANNATVLAKDNGDAYKFCNYKQVHNKKAELMTQGIDCDILDRGRVKYIKIN